MEKTLLTTSVDLWNKMCGLEWVEEETKMDLSHLQDLNEGGDQ